MTIAELREKRRPLGAFGWYIQCRAHGTDFNTRCLSCDMVQDHNWKIQQEIAVEMGWLLDEPAGDVPMAMSEAQEGKP